MNVTFKGSFEFTNQLPTANKYPEYCFIGRSNVGKSSLINMLTGRTVAHTSQNPGKTRHFNYFDIDNSWYLVDLPGYGYAKRSKVEREKWEAELRVYLGSRENLMACCVLIDISIPPQKIDVSFITELGENGVPFLLVFTKADRQKAIANENAVNAYMAELGEIFHQLPPYFVTSSESGLGKAELLKYIEKVNAGFK